MGQVLPLPLFKCDNHAAGSDSCCTVVEYVKLAVLLLHSPNMKLCYVPTITYTLIFTDAWCHVKNYFCLIMGP